MQTYLVGGAVRDELLGLDVRERDWVVVGASPDELAAQGFKPVGNDFPVFLHPQSGEEYALARTERKSGRGYGGFTFNTDPDVTLEDDLARRDLTINAMARTGDGKLVDPFGGEADLEARILRHVGPAFREDPLRVLRVARFAARFANFDFRIHPDTTKLLRTMSADGELADLTPERVWRETERALSSDAPQVYFEVLRDVGALAIVFPEIDALFGVPQPVRWHPEVDTGLHTLLVLEQAARLSASLEVRFAALTHDLGKGETPAAILPSHKGHEARSVALVERLAERLPVPKRCTELALLVAELHGKAHRIGELRAQTALKLLERTDALRRPQRFEQFILACEADSRGRTGLELDPYPQADLMRALKRATASVDVAALRKRGLDGAALGEAIRRERLGAVRGVLQRP